MKFLGLTQKQVGLVGLALSIGGLTIGLSIMSIEIMSFSLLGLLANAYLLAFPMPRQRNPEVRRSLRIEERDPIAARRRMERHLREGRK